MSCIAHCKGHCSLTLTICTAWYTDNTPTNDAQVAAHFSSKRPILGLCLKRYSFTVNGSAVRRNTYIDIPLEIGLPHFIQDDKMEDDGPLYGNFKLSLQSVVCHRGESVDSGHYISLVRGTSPNAQIPTGRPRSEPEQRPEDRWMRFDDLAQERITYIDIGQALKEESPYLLFYQVQPIDEITSDPIPSEDPPSYYESENKHSGLSDQSSKSNRSQRSHDDAAENARRSFDGANSEDPPPRSSISSERRVSIALTDGSGGALRPDQISTASASLTPNDESGGGSWRVSRRGSMFGKSGSKSRPSSQSGENRLSATFSRLALRLNKDKLWVPTNSGSVDGPPDEGTTSTGAVEADGGPSKGNHVASATVEKKKLKRGHRDKDKDKDREKSKSKPGRLDEGQLAGKGKGTGIGETDFKPPDRECTIM